MYLFYRNLNGGNFSIKAKVPERGSAYYKIDSASAFIVYDAKTKVSEATRVTMCKGKAAGKLCRQVHAYITGSAYKKARTVRTSLIPQLRRITYRPYERPDFFYADNGETFTSANKLLFLNNQVYELE